MSIWQPPYYDFTGCDCRGECFDGRNLTGANFEGVPLEEATFIGTNLHEANFRFTSLQDAVFEDADLRDADFWGANIDGTRFVRCIMRPDTLTKAYLHSQPIKEDNIVKSAFDEELERQSHPPQPKSWREEAPIILAPRRKPTSTNAEPEPEPKKRWPF